MIVSIKKILPLIIVLHTAVDVCNAQLFINEIESDNQSIEWDDTFAFEDWVEIFNDGGFINLNGYYLSDDPDSLTKYRVLLDADVAFTSIAPNGHIAIWCDNDTSQGPLHTNFKLSIDGEMVLLTAPDGITILDSISFPALPPDMSYGRETDGNSNWIFFNNTTFEDPNGEAIQGPEILFINEVQPNNTSTFQDSFNEYEPWVEIYNPNDYQVNVAGYYISNTSNELLWQIPNTNPIRTVIPAGGFVLLWCDNETTEDSNHTNFTLSSTGGTVILTAPNGTSEVDTYTYPSLGQDVSWGRSSDGGPNSIQFNVPTPRVSNQIIIIEPELLYINEVLSSNSTDTVDNYLATEDWFEVYNPNNFDINLGGYYFSDNPEVPTKWQVPVTFSDSVTVPANGWLLFWADEDAVQGVRHASFRLSNNGEELNFYSPDGFTLIDHIEWEHMGTDSSLGRMTDGNPLWWTFIGTTPEYSNNSGELTVKTFEAVSAFIVWPNPAHDFIKLAKTESVEIRTIDGRLCSRHEKTNEVEVSHLMAGVYLLITDSGKVARFMVK